jgi:hypothetical protein
MSRKISGFHGGDYEEWCLLGCYATRRNIPEDTILHYVSATDPSQLMLRKI